MVILYEKSGNLNYEESLVRDSNGSKYIRRINLNNGLITWCSIHDFSGENTILFFYKEEYGKWNDTVCELKEVPRLELDYIISKRSKIIDDIFK